MKVSIIIPNWNGKNLLEKNLPSVLETAENYDHSTEIIVVDDASTDDSVLFLKKFYPQVIILEKKTNEGFSSSVNLGVEKAHGEIVILLNSDIKPHPSFISYLVPHFKDKSVFAVGCLDESYENGNMVERGRGIAKFARGIITHWKGEVKDGITFWASGGSSAFNREKWLRLGGLDEMYNPFYGEDLDLGFRAWKAGFKVLFEPKSIVDHFHEEGAIKNNFTESYKRQITFRNQILFVWKNLTDKRLLLSHFFWLPYHLIKALLRLDLSFWLGFFGTLPLIKETTGERRKIKPLFVKKDKEVFALFEKET